MSAITFNADEIFAMAEKIELNGAQFYRTAAVRFPLHAELFTRFAVMEDTHYEVFKKMREGLSERQKEATDSDPDNQGELFAQDLADGYVFDLKKDPSQIVAGMATPLDVLKFAINIEKDSVIFYTSMKTTMRRAAGGEKIDAIIAEEMKHIAILNAIAVSL